MAESANKLEVDDPVHTDAPNGPASDSQDDEKQALEPPVTPAASEPQHVDQSQKPGILKRVLAKLGLEPVHLIIILKGGIAPIIALAAYQGNGFAEEFTTLGYLTAIMALLSMPIQPRAKFIQAILASALITCLAAAVALLEIQCVVSARQSTSRPAPARPGQSGSLESVQYNASASAVAAVWLCITIYIASFARAKRPQLQLQIIQYSIFTIVASTYAPLFPTMTAGKSFVRRLLVTFLTGFGIGTGVSLFIIPITSRGSTEKQIGGLFGLMKAAIGAHGQYMMSISEMHHERMKTRTIDQQHHNHFLKKHEKEVPKVVTTPTEQSAKAMKEVMNKIGGLFGKVKLEISFAKREIGYGKLYPEDYSTLFSKIQSILLPIIGLSTFTTIMQSVKARGAEWRALIDSDELTEAAKHLEEEEWDEVIAMSHDAYVNLKAALQGGLTHVSLVLELIPKPKQAQKDVESEGDASPIPGSSTFASYLQGEIEIFHKHRETAIRRWCDQKGIDLPSTFWKDPKAEMPMKDNEAFQTNARQRHNHNQLYLILFIEYLVWTLGHAILDAVQYADSKVEDGTMSKRRLINPGWRRIRKLFMSTWETQDSEPALRGESPGTADIGVGDALNHRKDPEHLPPSNAYERFTNHFRKIPKALHSPESAFAFRAVLATLSLAIMNYLRPTQHFFQSARGLWATIMIAISMAVHSGQSIFGFVFRILGTCIAMLASMAIWYIGYKVPGAILPVLYIYFCFGFWFLIKNPTLIVVAIISMVSAVLIIGYELQVEKIGIKVSEGNGQTYYPIYILAPYRLAAVVTGLAVAFFWSYFPYAVTTRTTLRKDLGSTLFILANFYSCVHTTVDVRLHLGSKVNDQNQALPVQRLDKARNKVFGKVILMLTRLREHSTFTKWDVPVGGKFPKAVYDDLINSMQNVFNYLALISYASNAFTSEHDGEESGWIRDFRRFTADLNITSHDMTSTFCLLAASISDARPLPPYLRLPKPFAVADRLERVDPGILSVKHVAEPCYAAFAVLEVASTLLTEEMAHIVKRAQDLVGEVDFDFHVISTSSNGSKTDSTLWEQFDREDGENGKGKQE